jgi:hypothetical protein
MQVDPDDVAPKAREVRVHDISQQRRSRPVELRLHRLIVTSF